MSSEAHRFAVCVRGAALAVCCLMWLCLASCGSAAGGIQAGDSMNGKSVTLHPGQSLEVMLSSTYWTFQGSSNSQVLVAVNTPIASPGSCRTTGSGCGTVTMTFRAVGPGTAQVTASRVSCGEALRCGSADGHYQLTVKVAAS